MSVPNQSCSNRRIYPSKIHVILQASVGVWIRQTLIDSVKISTSLFPYHENGSGDAYNRIRLPLLPSSFQLRLSGHIWTFELHLKKPQNLGSCDWRTCHTIYQNIRFRSNLEEERFPFTSAVRRFLTRDL